MIYIVIPVFNRWHFTKPCLDSLAVQTYKDFKVVVVDHGSTDGTREYIKQDYPWVHLLLGDESMWWAAATNLGLKYVLDQCSDEDFVLTLNNDLQINQDYLQILINVYSKKQNALVGSTSVNINDPEKISFCGVKWNAVTAKTKYLFLAKKYSEVANRVEFVKSDLLPGRGTLIPISAFKNVGLFDAQRFPHYAADQDLSLRAKKFGHHLVVSTRAIVYSHVNETGLKKGKRDNFISTAFKSFTSIKSPENLTVRFRWAQVHARVHPWLYFVFDVSRMLKSMVVKAFRY